MIGYLQGTLLAHSDESVLLLTAGGVGYQVFVPLPLLAVLPSAESQLRLHIVTVVRDDAIALYGFERPEGKRLFELLVRASGIGPKLAMNFLSAFRPAELQDAILNQDVALLSTIPGVGRKTASRLCLELGDRISQAVTAGPGAAPGGHTDLISALTNLGFPEKDVVPVVRQLSTESRPFEEQLRQALALLGRRTPSR